MLPSSLQSSGQGSAMKQLSIFCGPAGITLPYHGVRSVIGRTENFEIGEADNIELVQDHLIAERKEKQAKLFLASDLIQIQETRWQKILIALQK